MANQINIKKTANNLEDAPSKKLKLRLGEMLFTEGVLTPDQVKEALKEQEKHHEYLGIILMRNNWLSEKELLVKLSTQRNVPFFDVRNIDIPLEVIDLLPRKVVIDLMTVPISLNKDVLSIAMIDPFDEVILKKISTLTKHKVKAGFALRDDLLYAINRNYNSIIRSNNDIRDFFDGFAYLLSQDELDCDRVIDLILALGHLVNASHVHLTIVEDYFEFSLRIDGFLHQLPLPVRRLPLKKQKMLKEAIVRRSDAIRKANNPDSFGVIGIVENGKVIINTKVCISQILTGDAITFQFVHLSKPEEISYLSMNVQRLNLLTNILNRPSGLILVVSPGSSGRTTTLYTLLKHSVKPNRRVITLEEMSDQNLRFAMQLRMENKLNWTAKIEQLDADVVMIEPLDSPDIANLAVETAFRGQLVLAGIHGDNAAVAIASLLGYGVSPIRLAASLTLIMSQMLVPTLCKHCRRNHPQNAEMITLCGIQDDVQLYSAEGCANCYFTGRSGRILLTEIIKVDETLVDMIAIYPTNGGLMKHLKAQASYSFKEDAHTKCRLGLIDPSDLQYLL